MEACITWTAGCRWRRSGRCTIPWCGRWSVWLAPPSKEAGSQFWNSKKKNNKQIKHVILSFWLQKNFLQCTSSPVRELLEMELSRNCQIQVSKSVHGRALTHWKTRKVLRDATHGFWGNTHPGPCYPSVAFAAWFTSSFAPGKWEESGSTICWQWEAVRTHVSPVRCQLLRGLSAWYALLVLIDNNNKYFWLLIRAAWLFCSPAEEGAPTMAKVKSPWKVVQEGESSKALAKLQDCQVCRSRRALRSLKANQPQVPNSWKPLFKFKKKKRKAELRLENI